MCRKCLHSHRHLFDDVYTLLRRVKNAIISAHSEIDSKVIKFFSIAASYRLYRESVMFSEDPRK